MSEAAPTVRSIFGQAMEIDSPVDRAAFLDRVCGVDSPVRKEVESLLAALDKAGEFMIGPSTIDEPSITERPGSRIGPYKLMEQIGEGGFGLVFVAEQQEPVKRKVALKIIKPGMDSAQIMARFSAERQALALMDHPNIARVLDAGATDAGRPYFVMELVRGIPITEYCDQNQLAPRERLELFISVCQAIQHAHQKGIIHRDVKPSNVLVTSHDGKPVAKVIDFGVAKAISQQLTERTIYTNFAQMIGTPLYMSPEQAEMSGLDIDTRSDVYSLGVLLYELLTGTTPLQRKQIATAAYDEIRRLIREEEPPKPSTRVGTSDSIASIAAQRHTEPAKLSKLIRGDLDWITMKALEKDRTRRYETANGLARDVQRYLGNEAVEACPPSTSYRVKKFLHRNRRSVLTASVLGLALVVGTAVATWQAIRARQAEAVARSEAQAKVEALDRANRERDNAIRQRDRADQQSAVAEAVTDFLSRDILAQSSPFQQSGNVAPRTDLTLREALNRAAQTIGQRFRDQPVVEAVVRDTIANAYLEFSFHDEAGLHAEAAVSVLRQANKVDNPAYIKALTRLAWIRLNQNRDAESEVLHRELYERAHRVLDEKHPFRMIATSHYANCLSKQGKYELAEPLFHQAIEAELKARTDPQELQMVRNNLALMYFWQGRYELAEPLFQIALAEHRRLTSDLHPDTLLLVGNLANVREAQGRLTEAESLRRECLTGYSRVFAPSHGRTINALSSLCACLLKQKKFDEVEPMLRQLVRDREKADSNDWRTYYGKSMLGEVVLDQARRAGKSPEADAASRATDQFREAEQLLLAGYEGLKQRENTIPTQYKPVRLFEALNRLVQIYEATGKADDAAKWRSEMEKVKR